MGFLGRVDYFLRTKESIFQEQHAHEKKWGNEDLDQTPYVYNCLISTCRTTVSNIHISDLLSANGIIGTISLSSGRSPLTLSHGIQALV